MIKAWTDKGWDDYLYWHKLNDKVMIRKINRLITDIDRHPYTGIGKPEPLKYITSKNVWSRRITQEHRLVYRIEDNTIYILSAANHYS